MEMVLGSFFITNKEQVSMKQIERAEVVCVYFISNWCPLCHVFTSILEEFYQLVNASQKRLEIIQVNSDKNSRSFEEQLNTVPWTGIPLGDSRNESLKTHFGVLGVPLLMILNKDGSIAHSSALDDVQTLGFSCFEKWLVRFN